jgi:DNA-binding response OmpR family regulator
MRGSSKLSVLIIDPDPIIQQQLAQALMSHFQVLAANTLTEGFELIRRYRPQVILVELNQSDGDALVWIRQIRTLSWAGSMTIACITTRRGVRDKINGFQAGADDYLVKPIDVELILPRVVLLSRIRSLGID